MSINYGSAYRAFRKEQEKLREQYRQLGMTDEQIAAMYEFDLKEFKGDWTCQEKCRVKTHKMNCAVRRHSRGWRYETLPEAVRPGSTCRHGIGCSR